MEELASEMGWPDMNLFKEMRAGFKLVGNFEPTGIFKTWSDNSQLERRRADQKIPSSYVLPFWGG